MKILIEWLIVFVVIYLFYLFFVILRKKKINKFKSNTYMVYLIRIYKLDEKKLNVKKIAHLIALSNAFIIATAFIVVSFIENFLFKMLLSIIVLIPLQLLIYHIIGKYLKKGEDKNV